MNQWAELNDFSMNEGTLPCILCQGESSKTIVGNHWKCSACAHVFNQDGSDTGVECWCEKCRDAKEAAKGISADDLKVVLEKLKAEESDKAPEKKKKAKKVK